MYSKTTLSLAVLAVARLALANPYCLLTAVNKFEHPADQKTLCCKEAEKVKSYIEELCPSNMKSDAEDAFEKACKAAGLSGGDDCKSESSSSSVSGSKTSSSKAGSTSAPYPVTLTSTYFDNQCSCTKTKTYSSSIVAPTGSGFVTASNPIATGTAALPPSGGASGAGGVGSGPAATGSPITPPTPGGTGSSGSPGSGTETFTGAATKNVASVAAGLLAVAGIAIAL